MAKVVTKLEFKGIADRIASLFSTAFELDKITFTVDEYIDKQYTEGVEKTEIELDRNFIPNKQKLDFLKKYVKDHNDRHIKDIATDLSGEIKRSLMDGDDATKLKQKIKKVFKDKKYINRMKAVLRTEGLRANNYGALDGAEQSGLKLKKYVDVIVDGVTSNICLQEHADYGTKAQAIPLKDNFVVNVDGTVVEAKAPPFHPNCRTVIRFVREDKK